MRHMFASAIVIDMCEVLPAQVKMLLFIKCSFKNVNLCHSNIMQSRNVVNIVDFEIK